MQRTSINHLPRLLARPVAALAVLALGATSAVRAQGAPPARTGTIRLTVIDSGAPPRSRSFDVWGGVPDPSGTYAARSHMSARLIAPGRYGFDAVPSDSFMVVVSCPTIRPRYTLRDMDVRRRLRFVMREGLVIDTTIIVDHVGCDTRPIRTETRVFSGFWTPGFESSAFVPCAGDDWTLPSDSVGARREFLAWATLNAAGQRSIRRLEPPADAPRDAWGNATYFVRWHGTMEGPDQYGHMNVSPFSLTVDSLITIAKPDSARCGR